MVAAHDFGHILKSDPLSATLECRFTPGYSGFHALEIRNYRPTLDSDPDLWNFFDCIALEPDGAMLSSDGVTFSSKYGTELTMNLNAGPGHAKEVYWLLIGLSGTYPGLDVRGVNIPLNLDPLVELNLMKPGSLGSRCIGHLDELGTASASLYWKPHVSQIGITLYFAYVVLPPGKFFPVLAASNPINATAVPYQ